MAGDSKRFDSETEAMLFQGASLSQLSRLFCLDNRKTKEKLFGCKPKGMRAGSPVYDIAEAAQFLVKPILSTEEWISRMTQYDLPVELQKEFWAGQRSKQLFEIEAGDLWRTEKVLDHITEILKTISLQARLTSDIVDNEARLTPQQRAIVIRHMDTMLQNAHEALARAINDKKRAGNGSTTSGPDNHGL